MIVVDTNVISYLWLASPFTEAAERLLAHDSEWAAPLLWRSEFRSVLSAEVRRGTFTLDRAMKLAAAAEEQLQGREFPAGARQVLRLAAASGCTAYDCEYVALAQELAVPLVTNDHQVLKAFPKIAVGLRAADRSV